MVKILRVAEALSFPLGILNLLGGLVGFAWLVVGWHWQVIMAGVIALFVGPPLIGVAMMPGMPLTAAARHYEEQGRRAASIRMVLIANLYTSVVLAVWCFGVLELFLAPTGSGWRISSLLWSYANATGAITYMATHAAGELGSRVAVLFSELGFVAAATVLLISDSHTAHVAAAATIASAFAVSTAVTQRIARELPRSSMAG